MIIHKCTSVAMCWSFLPLGQKQLFTCDSWYPCNKDTAFLIHINPNELESTVCLLFLTLQTESDNNYIPVLPTQNKRFGGFKLTS